MASFTEFAAEYRKKKKKGQTFTEFAEEQLGTTVPVIVPSSTPQKTVEKNVKSGFTSDIAPVKKLTQTTTKKTSGYLDDGYDFGDISKTILGVAKAAGKSIVSPVVNSIKEDKAAEEKKQATFDETMRKKYSAMSLEDIEKEYSRIEKEEKEHKEKNGGKVFNYLAKVGTSLDNSMSGQPMEATRTHSQLMEATRTHSQANIDKIDDLKREKEILNIYRKKKATEEYLGGLDEKQLKMLDNIAEAKDLENAAPFSILAPQGGMDAATYSKITEVERTAGKEAREKLYNQLKKKNPKKSDDELNELIDNMVELRKSQVNAQENASMMMDIKGNGAASSFDPTLENKVGFATEHPVASFILSRGANLLGGVTGLAEMYMQRGNEYGLDTNAPGFALTNASSAIDEQVQLDHDWKIGEVDAFDLFYEVGAGMVDNVGRLALAGGNPTASGAIMFSQVATQGIIEGKEKGYSDSKALTMGLLQGTFEAISEKMGLDYVLGSGGGALKKLAKSFVSEGAEEVTSSWLNRIADQIANGKHSELSKQYEAYKNEGLTDAQALTNVVLNILGEDTKSFVVAGLSGFGVGGVAAVSGAVSNAKQEKAAQPSEDKLTDDEQKVFDKVVEDKITEATEDGKKTISKNEETKIRKAVLNDMLKGYIDTDTIESVLGGEEYESYKAAKDLTDENIASGNEVIENLKKAKDTLQAEYDTLNKMKRGEMTGEQIDRQNALKDKIADIESRIEKTDGIVNNLGNDTRLGELKTKLGQSVFGLVKDSRLGESYREIARSQQKFETDTSKYKNENARQTVQNAIDSGLFGNGNRAKEFVDFAAKLSADRGYVIEFTNTEGLEKLKQEGNKYNLEADVNRIEAFVSDKHKRIVVNADAHKSFDSLIGHEITHTLESAKSYKGLHNAIKSYLGDAEYNKTLEAFKKRYEGVDAVAEKELVAEFCGTRILTDYDFVKHLSTENRNVFQKVWDEIKYLCKIATAGSKEARDLERVKRNFEKAYKEVAKSGAKVEGVKNSLSEDDIYTRAYEMRIEVNELTKTIKEFEESDDFKSQMKKLSDAIANDDVENGIKAYQQWQKESGYEALIDKRDALKAELDSINKKAQEDYLNKEIEKEKAAIEKSGLSEADYFRKQAVKEFGYTPYFYDAGYITPNGKMLNFSGEKGKHYGGRGQDHRGIGTIYAETTGTDALNRFVRDGNIRIMAEAPGIDMSTVAEPTKEQYSTIRKFVYEYSDKGFFSVDFTDENGKVIGSLQYENRINPTRILNDIKHFYATGEIREQSSIEKLRYSLSPEQEAYFKNSKVRDENGNLKVMYHGTSKGGHTVFDTYGSKYGLFGQGSYFTDNKSVAESYTNKGKGNNKQVYESYLNITNPIDMDAEADVNAWVKALPDADFSNCTTNEDCYRAMEEYFEDEQYSKYEASEIAMDVVQGMGYDGITHIGGGRVNADGTRHQVYIAFEPEQIKNIDNIAPTKDADIRYSLTETDNEYLSAVENGDTETAQRMVDEVAKENGYTEKLYHGTTDFGFTKLDASQGDDGISFFATDSLDVARTYSGGDNARNISDKGMSEEYYDNLLESYDEKAREFVDVVCRTSGIYNFMSYRDNKFDEFRRTLEEGTDSFDNVSSDLLEYVDEIVDSLYDNALYYDDSLTEEDFYESDEISKVYDAMGDLQHILKGIYNYEDGSIGNYQFYANTEGLFEIDAEGKRWNQIPFDKYDTAGLHPIVSTRQLSRYAKYEGYKGVKITNVFDDGGRSTKYQSKPATVYIFFEPQAQVKSADTVTYDDNGNVIPLSERFKSENNDIRYSLSEDSEGNKLTEKQSEYFANTKAIDKKGSLKVVYHGTRNADFTVFKRNATYFTDSKEMADSYSPNGAMFEGYVNITKPYEIDAAGEKWSRIPIDNDTANFLKEYGSSVFKEGGKWRTTPADIASALEEAIDNGDVDYDGIIIKNIDDTGNYYKDKETHLATDYIVFNSNQFKKVDNKAPTTDPDIRFSLSENVEETKDLMALHNLHSNELMKQLKMGGIAYPSVAVTKPGTLSHEGFGDITLILNKDAIDPKKSKYNKLYSADAYTPTFPNVNYEASRDVANNIANKVKSLYEAIPEDYKRSLTAFRDYTNIDERLNSARGEEGLIERYLDDYSFKQLYLADKGETVPTKIKRTETQITEYQKEQYQFVVDRLGAELLESSKPMDSYTPPLTARVQWYEQHGEALKEAYAEYWAADGTMTKEEALEIANSEGARYWVRQIKAITDYIKTGGMAIKEEADINATNALIDEKINVAEYKEWLTNLFSGIEGSSGIRNSKDLFTPSGKRRSFSQLHDPVTIDNVIKVMRKQGQTGQGAFGTGNIQGASAQEFGSIAVMKENSDRLGVMDEAEHEEITQQINDRIFEIAKRYSNGKDLMDAQTTIVEAVSKNETKAGIARYLKQFDYVYKYTDSIGDDIIELRDYIRSIPTPYFEAKPQRAVGFDEVAVFVIPRDADIKVKQELLNKGYSIAEYDPKIEGDRQRVVNSFEKYKFSLSDGNEVFKDYGRFFGKDILYRGNDIAPVKATVSKTEKVAPSVDNWRDVANTIREPEFDAEGNWTEDYRNYNASIRSAVSQAAIDEVIRDIESGMPSEELKHKSIEAIQGYNNIVANNTVNEYKALQKPISPYGDYAPMTEAEAVSMMGTDKDYINSFTDADMPPKMDAPIYDRAEEGYKVESPLEDRDIYKVGNRKVKAYMYENPEVKPYFQEAAEWMLGDLHDTVKGERTFNDELYYESGGELGWMGTKRHTSPEIADLLDNWHYTYDQIEKGLKAIIEDNGAENNAISKRIEFALDEMLRNGHTFFADGTELPPNQEYINLLLGKQITEYNDEAFNYWASTLSEEDVMSDDFVHDDEAQKETVDYTEAEEIMLDTLYNQYTLYDEASRNPEKILNELKTSDDDIAPTKAYEAIRPKPVKQPKMVRVNKVSEAQRQSEEILGESQVGTKTPEKKKGGTWSDFVRNFVSKGAVFESLKLKTGNRAVEDKYKMWKDRSGAKAQYFMEHGKGNVKSLKSIADTVKESGLEKEFDLYMKHRLNVDRMKVGKPVFGDDVTAEMSMQTARKLQTQHPEFRKWAKDVYAYNDYLRQMLVDGGIVSKETADLWAKQYPNYIPIERLDKGGAFWEGKGVGIAAPIKRATGGNSSTEYLLKTLAHRTTQVFKAVAKNDFGVELKNTLKPEIGETETNTEEAIEDLVTMDEGLLQPGKNGKNPTFTVLENGERVTFEISEEMYKALQPTTEALSREHKILSKPSAWHKKVLTEYNLFFTARNFPKDAQEVIFNSNHAAETYANMPVAFKQLLKGKGKYVTEFWENGGKSNTYFDERANDFMKDDTFVKKAIGLVPNGISKVNDFVEAIPRLAEYIASRKNGATIEAAMLDAARVTTDFSDGGDITKFFNRNGVTFLNASVQGAAQQVRNIREAKAEGFKGVMKLVGKYALAGLPVLLFNSLMWDDDEEYEELSDYVKDNYYIVAKYGDGQFVRIPKGRTAAVIQEAFEQLGNTFTGKETDWANVLSLAKSNLSPNNPIDNNILAPIKQVATNTAWYGDDIVPTRLQDMPTEEQYDETIDSISKWLGENFDPFDLGPYKINYLLNQYSGFVGDMTLPYFTPEAENDISPVIAPLADQFTVDSVIKNRNASDFYTTKEELTVKANSKDATDEDILKEKYINSVNTELSNLYKEKREIQNSNLSDALKFKQVRDVQKQINDISRNALNTYEDVKVNGRYATIGDRHYMLNDKGEWQKITDEQLEKQNEAIGILGITPSQYWSNKKEYDMAAFYPEKYAVLQEQGISVEDYKENYEESAFIYTDDYSWAANNPEKYTLSKAITDDFAEYRQYTSELNEIKADKDSNGKTISGSAKEKKKAYIWSLPLDYGQKIILYRSLYDSKDDKAAYNQDIIDYLNSRDDISYDEMNTICEELGFTVNRETGYISW